MAWLVIGVLLWSVAHLLPSAGATTRTSLVHRLGEGPYRGLFSLLIVASVVLMIVGWRSSGASFVYAPPAWGRWAANGLMLVALLLFVASAMPTNLKRRIRHPQLTGLGLWSLAHLLANGDARSLVLFGGLGIWALLAIGFINRRDGAWQKPTPQPPSADVKLAAATVVGFAVVFLLHPYLFGASPVPQ